jgi:16S rRNA processing protein RimM
MGDQNTAAASTTASASPSDDLLRVCRIGRAQGLKGEVNVYAYTDEPELRFAAGSVLVDAHGRTFTVSHARMFKQRWILSFEGVSDRNASEALNGTTLYITREQAEQQDRQATQDGDAEEDLDEEGYYLEDLVRLTAKAPDGTTLGTVTDVLEGAAQDLLQIAEPGGHTSLVPFVDAFVQEVDPDAGRLILDVPKGLLAEYPPQGDSSAGQH